MAENNLMNSLTDHLKDQPGKRVNQPKGFGEGDPKMKRGAFWTCLLAALLLMLLCLAGSIACNVTKVSLFKQGMDTYVVGAGVISQSDSDAFVKDTLDYLTGVKAVWEPAVTLGDHRIVVPEAFQTHMGTVRGWVISAQGVLLAGAAIALLLLGCALIGTKRDPKGSFSVGGYYLGAAIPLFLITAAGLWGVLNFEGLWAWVHRTFIPDGIFNAGEEVMKLFPVTVFQYYLEPVAVSFGICAAGVLALPLILVPLGRWLTVLFGKKNVAASGGSATH